MIKKFPLISRKIKEFYQPSFYILCGFMKRPIHDINTNIWTYSRTHLSSQSQDSHPFIKKLWYIIRKIIKLRIRIPGAGSSSVTSIFLAKKRGFFPLSEPHCPHLKTGGPRCHYFWSVFWLWYLKSNKKQTKIKTSVKIVRWVNSCPN